MTASFIHRYPYIRLIIPWIAGVFCGDCFYNSSWQPLWGIFVFAFLACLCIAFYFLKSYSLRWCFGTAVSALFFTGGWVGITWQLHQTDFTFSSKETVYRALLLEAPQEKERSYLCPVFVKEYCDSNAVHSIHTVERKVIIYLAQDSLASRLKQGDEILFSARISPPENGHNFDEFDYARYLQRKGISGTGYVASKNWSLLSSVDTFANVTTSPSNASSFSGFSSFRFAADVYREKLISVYRKLGFNGDNLAILSALTVGDKTELSESVRESYSIAGASHVLALSGLHIGLLYGLFLFVMKPLANRGRGGRLCRSLFLLLLLWAFAFFTGLSPSVVRSVCMFSVLAIADMFSRKSLTINTLSATAWVMLLFNPVWLFDVGFQLSFMAVAFILMIQPSLYRSFPVKSRVGKFIWGVMSVSIAAQLGTAPLVMFYFSRFSTHFLLTNLVVIPLVGIILYSAVVMLALTPFIWLQSLVAEVVRWLLNGLTIFVQWVERLPYASIDRIWLYPLEVCGIYIFLLLIFYYFINRRLRNLVVCLLSVLLLVTFHTTMYWKDHPRTSIVFYNVRGCPVVHCIKSDGRSWVCYGDTLANKKRLQRVSSNYWNRHHLLPPVEVNAITYQSIEAQCAADNPSTDNQSPELCCQQQILSYHGCRIGMITDNRWRNKSASSPLSVHYLYLCKGYNGHMEELTHLFFPSCVILDASLSEYRKELLKNECKQFGIDFISLSEKGSVRFLL